MSAPLLPTTLCVPPRPGELCAPVTVELAGPQTFLELTSRHRITAAVPDEAAGTVAVTIEFTDPAGSRSVHVRFDLVADDEEVSSRSRLLARYAHDGRPMAAYGTYLGVVSDEN
ncbi:hypothetical protein [Trujillonella endophytica]|uniref:Uncharacterized protein n=1 Tax=Trujillonella endophytica TaxID=673521 RepID=A0A1H8VXR9_9ACTN|nr:hypothetical protein [Trujillella endophytica]SEP20145.1 hypothetical protein SAMN05660991_03881 [Trujillella endophytica]